MGLIHHQCCWAAARPAHVHTGRPVLPSWSLITDLPFLFSGLAQRECFSLQALSSVAQLCPTLCDPMACSMPGFPVHHQLPELAQTQVHQVGDVIPPSYLSSVVPFYPCLQSFPASGSFPTSQFFTLGGQSIGVSASPSFLPMNIQDGFLLGWTGLISLQSKGLSSVFSNTTVQKHQFFGTQLSF